MKIDCGFCCTCSCCEIAKLAEGEVWLSPSEWLQRQGPKICGYSAFDFINIYCFCTFGDEVIDYCCCCCGAAGPAEEDKSAELLGTVPTMSDVMSGNVTMPPILAGGQASAE